jgi:hypothetical protein
VTLSGHRITTQRTVQVIKVPIAARARMDLRVDLAWPVQTRRMALGRHEFGMGLEGPRTYAYAGPSLGDETFERWLAPVRVQLNVRSSGTAVMDMRPDPTSAAFGQFAWQIPKQRRALIVDLVAEETNIRRLIDLIGDTLFLAAGFLFGMESASHGGGLRGSLARHPRETALRSWSPPVAFGLGVALWLAAEVTISGTRYADTLIFHPMWGYIFHAPAMLTMLAFMLWAVGAHNDQSWASRLGAVLFPTAAVDDNDRHRRSGHRQLAIRGLRIRPRCRDSFWCGHRLALGFVI